MSNDNLAFFHANFHFGTMLGIFCIGALQICKTLQYASQLNSVRAMRCCISSYVYISFNNLSFDLFSSMLHAIPRSIDRDERAKATRVVGQCRDSGIIRPSATLLTRSTCGIRTYVRRLGCSKFAPFDRSAVQCHLICTHDNPRHGRHATYVL